MMDHLKGNFFRIFQLVKIPQFIPKTSLLIVASHENR